jgi:hypothetical protein
VDGFSYEVENLRIVRIYPQRTSKEQKREYFLVDSFAAEPENPAGC